MSIRICNGKLSTKNGNLQIFDQEKCCVSPDTPHKCNVVTKTCSGTSEPITNPDVYPTRDACETACAAAEARWKCNLESGPPCTQTSDPLSTPGVYATQVDCETSCADIPSSRHKCNRTTKLCDPTSDPLGTPNVFATKAACDDDCVKPLICGATSCSVLVVFYYMPRVSPDHCCNAAEWDAYAAYTGRYLGHVNLNNLSDCSIYKQSDVTIELADANPVDCTFGIYLRCSLSGCHEGFADAYAWGPGGFLYLPDSHSGTWVFPVSSVCSALPLEMAKLNKVNEPNIVCMTCPGRNSMTCEIAEQPLAVIPKCPIDRW